MGGGEVAQAAGKVSRGSSEGLVTLVCVEIGCFLQSDQCLFIHSNRKWQPLSAHPKPRGD